MERADSFTRQPRPGPRADTNTDGSGVTYGNADRDNKTPYNRD